MSPEPATLTLGELKATLNDPRLFGVMPAPMDDSREVVVQVPVGEDYEYYQCRAAGVLFLGSRFVLTIAAGDRIGSHKRKRDTMPEEEPKLVEYFQAIGVPIFSLQQSGSSASIFAPMPEGTGVKTYDEATALGQAELTAGRWRSFRIEKFYRLA